MEFMKKKNLVLIGIILFFSCQKDNDYQPNENCEFKTEISAPEGFEINLISTIQFNGGLNEIQFIDENIGFILGSSNVGGFPEIFKTNNGGITWTDLKLGNRNSSGSVRNMFFLTKEVGFISHYGLNGNLLKTTNGGLDWTEMSYQNLNGVTYHIQKDNNNNLYAILFRVDELETQTVLIKSIDEGENWQIINDSPELDISLVTFSFKLFEDKIYISGDNGKIIVTDLNGNQINVIQTDISNIRDLEIIDHNNIVVAGSKKTIKSSDGGLNWTTIYDKSARIINFTNSEKGLMLLNKSYCPGDVYQVNDVIAYTEDGGITWMESQEFTNLSWNYRDYQKRADGSYIIMLRNELFRINKK